MGDRREDIYCYGWSFYLVSTSIVTSRESALWHDWTRSSVVISRSHQGQRETTIVYFYGTDCLQPPKIAAPESGSAIDTTQKIPENFNPRGLLHVLMNGFGQFSLISVDIYKLVYRLLQIYITPAFIL